MSCLTICDMDSVQLTSILSSNPHTRKTFHGVFPSDMLPRGRLQQRPVSLVVNTHPHNLPGEHWLAIYLSDDKKGEFFDSYGHAPTHQQFPKTIMKFLRRNASVTIFQPRQLQAPESSVCGYHCVFFLHHRSKGLTFKQIQEMYSRDLGRNDQMVEHFVKNKDVPRPALNMFQPAQGCVSCNVFHRGISQ